MTPLQNILGDLPAPGPERDGQQDDHKGWQRACSKSDLPPTDGA